MATVTGQAWSFPHRTGNVLTDAFCETTFGSSAWSEKGSCSSAPEDIADSDEQMHGVGGYQFTVDADGEGIEQSLTGLDAGENYVLRLLAHEEGPNLSGSELLDNTTFDSDTSDWIAGNNATLSSVSGGQSNNCLEVDNAPGFWGYAYQEVSVTRGRRYRLSVYHKDDTSFGLVKVGTLPSRGDMVSESISDASWTQHSWDFVAQADTIYVRLGVSGNDDSYVTLFDEVSLQAIDEEDIRIHITDDTNTADILDFTVSPGQAYFSQNEPMIVTWELPTNARNGVGSDCTAMTVSVEGTVNGQTVWVHQCEVYENLVDNPSLETGAGDPWIPDGWTNSGLDAGDTEAEATTVHSGSGSVEFNTGAVDERIYSDTLGIATGAFLSVGMWVYGDGSAGLSIVEPGSDGADLQDGTNPPTINGPITSNWSHVPGVWRMLSGTQRYGIMAGTDATGDRFADDIYAIPLTAVSLTATPQSEANSTESGAISVTGRDMLTMPWAHLTATEGRIRFKWTPRHGAAELLAFKDGGALYHLRAVYDPDNYIFLSSNVPNDIRITCRIAGSQDEVSWSCNGEIVAGTTYTLEIRYDSTKCELLVDGIVKITAEPAGGIEWEGLPSIIRFGDAGSAGRQVDAAFAAP